MDPETPDIVVKIYELVVEADVHCVSSIIVAVAVIVIANSWRDINIIFMNELSIIYHKMRYYKRTEGVWLNPLILDPVADEV